MPSHLQHSHACHFPILCFPRVNFGYMLILLLHTYTLTYLLTYCVSERVGWVPAEEEVPEAVKSTYRWIEGLSVTEMEIMHGAYRKDNPNGA